MKIDNKQLMERTGMSFESETDMYYYIMHHLEYLMTHNKNYTAEQARKIDDLYEIMKAIDIWNEGE